VGAGDRHARFGSRWSEAFGPLFVSAFGWLVLAPQGFPLYFLVPWTAFGLAIAVMRLSRAPVTLDVHGSELVWRSALRSGSIPVRGIVKIERYRNGGGTRFVLDDGSSLAVDADPKDMPSIMDAIRLVHPGLEVEVVKWSKLGNPGYRGA
jgi:hypothetical protein